MREQERTRKDSIKKKNRKPNWSTSYAFADLMMHFIMLNLDGDPADVGDFESSVIGDSSVQRVSHGFVVGVFLSPGAAVGVVASEFIVNGTSVHSVISWGDGHEQFKGHSILVTLGQEKTAGVTTSPNVIVVKVFALSHGRISFINESLERFSVWNGDWRIGWLAENGVMAGIHCWEKKTLG